MSSVFRQWAPTPIFCTLYTHVASARFPAEIYSFANLVAVKLSLHYLQSTRYCPTSVSSILAISRITTSSDDTGITRRYFDIDVINVMQLRLGMYHHVHGNIILIISLSSRWHYCRCRDGLACQVVWFFIVCSGFVCMHWCVLFRVHVRANTNTAEPN